MYQHGWDAFGGRRPPLEDVIKYVVQGAENVLHADIVLEFDIYGGARVDTYGTCAIGKLLRESIIYSIEFTYSSNQNKNQLYQSNIQIREK